MKTMFLYIFSGRKDWFLTKWSSSCAVFTWIYENSSIFLYSLVFWGFFLCIVGISLAGTSGVAFHHIEREHKHTHTEANYPKTCGTLDINCLNATRLPSSPKRKGSRYVVMPLINQANRNSGKRIPSCVVWSIGLKQRRFEWPVVMLETERSAV